MNDSVYEVPLTQGQGTSQTSYEAVILFKWDLNNDHPFYCVPLSALGTDFPMEVITGPLSESARLAYHKMRGHGGKEVSLFCKIQKSKKFFFTSLSRSKEN